MFVSIYFCNFANIKNEFMSETRENKIKRIFKQIHGNHIPMFYWDNHTPMRYEYSPINNSITCDCGVSISLESIEDEDINFQNILSEIFKLEECVWDDFKNNRGVVLETHD